MSEIVNDRMRKVKSILVTQESPTDANSPYLKLAEKFNVKIDFIPFIQVVVLDKSKVVDMNKAV